MADDARQVSLETKRSPRSEAVKNWVQTIAIITAGIWGVSTWFYVYVYLPRIAPPHVTMKIDTERFGEKDGLISVKAFVSIKNNSRQPLYNVGNAYLVYGIDVEKHYAHESPEKFVDSVVQEMNSEKKYQTMLHRNVRIRGDDILGAGRMLNHEFKLEPGQEYHNEFLVYAPIATDYLRVVGFVHYVGKLTEKAQTVWERQGVAKLSAKYGETNTPWTIEEVVVPLW